uniref:Uncharacterized protein n=2 Tax=Dunaliella tertiolecta TaxID=3047 RepID=A0A7S3VPQ4_DUNTE
MTHPDCRHGGLLGHTERERKSSKHSMLYSLCTMAAGMEDSLGIMGESQETLSHRKKVVGEKQRALHQEWQTQVFDKIQERLDKALSKTSPRETEARLQAQMDDFLRTGNTKAGIYRDVICEQDYDPLSTRSRTLKVQTGDLFDPLKRDWIKARNERLNMGLSAGTSGQLARDTFDTKMWSEQNVHSTPYGHCVDKTGAYVVHPLSQSVLEQRRSKLVMDHYNYPNRDNAAAAAELGLKSGKGMPPGPGAPDTRDVLTHQCHLHPEVRKGDIWLEQRGKGHAPPPEAGHVDMREVLHQTASGDRGRHGGDEWLKPRGRAKPPPPERKTGRSDLKEVIFQTTNPYRDGRGLDDAWLQRSGKPATAGPQSELGSFIYRSDHPPLPSKPRDIRQNASSLRADVTLHPADAGTGRFVGI